METRALAGQELTTWTHRDELKTSFLGGGCWLETVNDGIDYFPVTARPEYSVPLLLQYFAKVGTKKLTQ